MAYSIELNGVLLTTKAYNVESLPLSIPGRRGSDIIIPYKHGARNVTRKPFDVRTEALNMWVTGKAADGTLPAGTTRRQQLESNIEYLKSIFGTPGLVPLRILMQDGTYRVAQVEVMNAIAFKKESAFEARMSVELMFADPFYYNEEQTIDEQIIDSLSFDFAHNNPGTSQVTKAIITLTGPLSTVKITNNTNGVWCKYNGIINDEETVVIDMEFFTVEMGVTNYVAILTHEGSPFWMLLNPGNNDLNVTTDRTGGSIELKYFPAYL